MGLATQHLFLIKKRVLSLNTALKLMNGRQVSADTILVADHAFLDVRKIIEELMLLALCAHDRAGIELSAKMRREWNAERLMRHLERLNSNCFPAAVDIEASDEPGIEGIIVPSPRSHLTKAEAISIYNYCGSILHASNTPISPKDLEERFERLDEFDEKIRGLLETFEVDISGAGFMVCGHLLIDDPNAPPLLFGAPSVPASSSPAD